MSLVKKLKDILFEEEEYTDTIKVVPDNKRDEVAKNLAKEEELMKEEVKITEQKQYNNFNNNYNNSYPNSSNGTMNNEGLNKVNTNNYNKDTNSSNNFNNVNNKFFEEFEFNLKENNVAPTPNSEREMFQESKGFVFPDFDEDEFASTVGNVKEPNHVTRDMREKRVVSKSPNVLEYERKKTYEKRTDYGRYERVETKEITEKKKFKQSPIISPVYGILNQDYKAEDIIDKKERASNVLDIDSVRKKAFEQPRVEEKIEMIEEEPVVTFFEEKDTIKLKESPKKEDYKTINDLLEAASDEISLEDTLEIPKANHLDAIEEELEKLEIEPRTKMKDFNDLDSDLFELIDSMYEGRKGDN